MAGEAKALQTQKINTNHMKSNDEKIYLYRAAVFSLPAGRTLCFCMVLQLGLKMTQLRITEAWPLWQPGLTYARDRSFSYQPNHCQHLRTSVDITNVARTSFLFSCTIRGRLFWVFQEDPGTATSPRPCKNAETTLEISKRPAQ